MTDPRPIDDILAGIRNEDRTETPLPDPSGSLDRLSDESLLRLSDGSRPGECCLLAEGFAVCSKTTPEGYRQILSVHLPGEIPDLQSLHLHVMDHDLTTLSPCTLGFMSHSDIRDLCRKRPTVADALWRETLIDSAIFRECIVNVGQRPAAGRLAHTLLELHTRLKAIGKTRDGEFDVSITQDELSDCLGISAVHANRVLQELRRDGLINVERSDFRILDRQRLVELAGFDPLYLHLSPDL